MRLYHLAPGQPLLLAVRLPGATGLTPLNSQVAFSSQASGSAFQNRRQWKVSSVLPEPRCLPGQMAFLSRIQRCIVADFISAFWVCLTVLVRSSNRKPSG
ncbi:MAG TPA: hypothetical protein PLW02_09950 [Verrucomicrobiota bacterium]|nr:hypothetical protein [Verrucomicrobiota bacterium]